MIDETILLLTYYYNQEDRNHRLLRHIISRYSPAYLPWDIYLYQPLKETFSKVILYDYLKRRAEIGIEAMNQEIIDLVRREGVKYVLWTSFHYDVLESTLDTLRSEGAIVVGWFFDDEWRFDTYSKYWAGHLDYCGSCAIESIRKYRAMNVKAIQTITNTGVAVGTERPRLNEKYAVTFVGTTRIANRKQYLEALRESRIPVQVFGEGAGGYVSFEDMLDIFSASKINLNFSGVGAYGRTRQIKGRIFQVCLAGGFLLTEYAPDIESYYKVGEEIVCFDTADEMVEKVRYYLHHEDERRAIAQAGWKRAKEQYTASHIVRGVFAQIEQDRKAGLLENRSSAAKFKMPLLTRTTFPSHYHFQWGRALMREHYDKRLWRDSLSRSLAYSPLNISAWYHLILGLLPSPVRPPFFWLHDNLVRLPGTILRQLRNFPLMGPLIHRIMKRIV